MKAVRLIFCTALVCTASCKKSAPPSGQKSGARPSPTSATVNLQGAGATFPYPLYSKWVAEYQKTHPHVRINYQSIGSGGGIRQITERTVDFGASDAPMTDAELAKAPGKLLHIPTTLGAVVVAYNVPGVPPGLKLTPAAIAGIFLGEINSWNDPAIAAANPDVKLPAVPVAVVYRSDGSGTTAVFTEYVAKINPAWKERVGSGKSVRFPVGLGAKGNEGVAGQIRTTPGSVGYLELAYAKQANLSYVAVRNRAGQFVEPSPDGISAAAASVARAMPKDLRVSIVDAPGDAAYPLSAFTYILVYEDQPDAVRGRALAQFLWWAIHDGQAFGAPLHYAPLPSQVVLEIESKLRLLRSGGRPLLAAH